MQFSLALRRAIGVCCAAAALLVATSAAHAYPTNPDNAPFPLHDEFIIGNYKDSLGGIHTVLCTFELGADHPNGASDYRYLLYVGATECNEGVVTQSGQAKLWDFANLQRSAVVSTGTTFSFTGKEGFSHGYYTRVHDAQTQQIEFNVTMSLPVALGDSKWTNVPDGCSGVNTRTVTCRWYSPPFQTIPYPPEGTYVTDEDGDVPTAPLIAEEALVNGLAPPGDPTTPLLYYDESGPAGPLTVDAVLADVTGAQAQPISTGACRLHNPDLYRAYAVERARQGRAPWLYGTVLHASCGKQVGYANCATELWRGNVFVDDDIETNNLGDSECLASAISPYYRRPTKHYSKNIVTMRAPGRNFWGTGRGPMGWECTGQNTKTLQCRRDTAPES